MVKYNCTSFGQEWVWNVTEMWQTTGVIVIVEIQNTLEVVQEVKFRVRLLFFHCLGIK